MILIRKTLHWKQTRHLNLKMITDNESHFMYIFKTKIVQLSEECKKPDEAKNSMIAEITARLKKIKAEHKLNLLSRPLQP